MNKLEEICDKQNNCKDCPLLIARVVVPDETYDYHETNICYLKKYNRIKEIESFILNNLKDEIDSKIDDSIKQGLSKEEIIKIVKKLINENEENL